MAECVSPLQRATSAHRGEVRECRECGCHKCARHRVGDVCRACKSKQYRRAYLMAYPRTARETWAHRDLVETVAELAGAGTPKVDMIARVGVGWSAILKAHRVTGSRMPEPYYNPPPGRGGRKDEAGGGTQEAKEELAGSGADGSALEDDSSLPYEDDRSA